MGKDTLEQDMLISVIIPVYNSANSLPQCINSILEQRYKNFELLLINDGSADCSLEIMNSFAGKDQRVKVIDKIKNSGVSDTRNMGISHAKGKIICFIDSDDWVEKIISRFSLIIINHQILYFFRTLYGVKPEIFIIKRIKYRQILQNYW
ncbi:glycosyltransferase family 2 protein [Chryseobacterium sp. 1B4]